MSKVRGINCPLCGKPRVADFKPFCSKGCRDRDLLAWFGESYRVPVAGEPETADTPADDEDERTGEY